MHNVNIPFMCCIKKIKTIVTTVQTHVQYNSNIVNDRTWKTIHQKNRSIKILEKETNNASISKPIRRGCVVSVVGKPNTGKSSFVNYISKKEVSIKPGSTPSGRGELTSPNVPGR